jgi:hypothetical protein
VGAGPYVWLIITRIVSTGELWETLGSALFGDHYAAAVLNLSLETGFLKNNAVLLSLSLLNPLWIFLFSGLRHLRNYASTVLVRAVYALIIIEALFFVRYAVPDQATFSLRVLFLSALVSSVGVHAFAVRHPWARKLFGPTAALTLLAVPVILMGVLGLMRENAVEVPRPRFLPFRDEGRYWILPWKHDERSAQQFSAQALAQASEDAVIFADSTAAYPLMSLQKAWGLSPGTDIMSPLDPEWYDPMMLRRRLSRQLVKVLYIVTPVPGFTPTSFLESACGLEREGALFRVSSIDC